MVRKKGLRKGPLFIRQMHKRILMNKLLSEITLYWLSVPSCPSIAGASKRPLGYCRASLLLTPFTLPAGTVFFRLDFFVPPVAACFLRLLLVACSFDINGFFKMLLQRPLPCMEPISCQIPGGLVSRWNRGQSGERLSINLLSHV